VRRLVAATGVAATVLVGAPAAAVETPDDDARAVLEQVVDASQEVAYQGRVVIASFSDEGPEVTEMQLTQGADGEMRVRRGESWELGRIAGEGYLRTSTDTLLRLSGVERAPFDLDRLLGKYVLEHGGALELDTGPAIAIRLRDRSTGAQREALFVDEDSHLVVRRETHTMEGELRRVIAFTDLELEPIEVQRPDDEDLDVEEQALAPADIEALADEGFVVPDRLPAGFVRVGGYELAGSSGPTLHLVYSDGLYSLSLYQQQGRLAASAVSGATKLSTEDGGHVWRWPGSEPRRVVWTGDRLTFTALTDAPTDEVLTVAAGLPTEAAPSILDRLGRGLSRVGQWLFPTDRST
jgi:negative regulator of sigma E activity